MTHRVGGRTVQLLQMNRLIDIKVFLDGLCKKEHSKTAQNHAVHCHQIENKGSEEYRTAHYFLRYMTYMRPICTLVHFAYKVSTTHNQYNNSLCMLPN